MARADPAGLPREVPGGTQAVAVQAGLLRVEPGGAQAAAVQVEGSVEAAEAAMAAEAAWSDDLKPSAVAGAGSGAVVALVVVVPRTAAMQHGHLLPNALHRCTATAA